MADWRTRLRPASLGGVPFHVKSRGETGGRAIDNHEFPKRNSGFAEDMGRESRKLNVEAYVIGADYMQQRDALVAVCEKEGAKSYVDHWGRSLKVVVDSYDLKESSDEGRIAHVSIKLIEAGSSLAPIPMVATAFAAIAGAGGLQTAALTSFAESALVGQLPAALAAVASSSVGGLAGSLSTLAGGPLIGLSGIVSDVSSRQIASLPASILARAPGSPLSPAAAAAILDRVRSSA